MFCRQDENENYSVIDVIFFAKSTCSRCFGCFLTDGLCLGCEAGAAEEGGGATGPLPAAGGTPGAARIGRAGLGKRKNNAKMLFWHTKRPDINYMGFW